MNYEERMTILKEWFKTDMMSRFAMPRDLDPKVVAMDVIESINRNIPSGLNKQQMGSLVASITKEITQSARTRTLPSVKEFMDALKNTPETRSQPRTVQSTHQMDDYALSAQRIRQQSAVSDMYLRDPHRKKLIEEYNITYEDLAPYDKWLAMTAHKQ